MLKCEITLRRGCFPVNVLHIVRTPFLKTPLVGCFCNFQVYHIPLCSYLPYLPYFILQAEIFSLSTDKLIPQRSSHRRCSVKKSVLFKRNDSGTDVFPVNFVKFLRAPFLQNPSGRLLLSALTFFPFAYLSSPSKEPIF